MALKLITPPTQEPVTLAETKLHLRVDIADDDALIGSLITAAREEIERQTWHALVTQVYDLVLDRWPCHAVLELPRPPLQSVTSVSYKTAAGAVVTLDTSKYIVASDTIPARLMPAVGMAWPGDALWPVEAIRIRYTCGWADGASVPQSLKQAVLLLVGYWYAQREAVITGTIAKEAPYAIEMLCASYRKRVMP